MKVLQVVVFFVTVTLSFAAVAYLPNAKHPDYPGHCYYEGPPEVLLKIGQTARDKLSDCGIVTCNDDYTLSWASCGVVRGPDDCRLESDLTLEYPDCCPRVKCDTANRV